MSVEVMNPLQNESLPVECNKEFHKQSVSEDGHIENVVNPRRTNEISKEMIQEESTIKEESRIKEELIKEEKFEDDDKNEKIVLFGAANNLYKTKMCKNYDKDGKCPYGKKCRFAHGTEDVRKLSKHDKYKTEPCKLYYGKDGICPYGKDCAFLHELPSVGHIIACDISKMSIDLYLWDQTLINLMLVWGLKYF